MVGINFNGIVQGQELRSVANEILNRAKSQNTSGKAKEAATKNINENPFSGENIFEFVPIETKNAKKDFQQKTLQIDNGLQQTINSQAAIDRYSKFATKEPSEKSENHLDNKISEELLEINSAQKDKRGKNPFAFLKQIPQNQAKSLNEEQLRSIFDALSSKEAV